MNEHKVLAKSQRLYLMCKLVVDVAGKGSIQSAEPPEDVCVRRCACCVGIRTRVCGSCASLFGSSASTSASFGFGNFAMWVSISKTTFRSIFVLEAKVIARRTLCQFERTAAMAGHHERECKVVDRYLLYLPSVPSESVASLFSNSCI